MLVASRLWLFRALNLLALLALLLSSCGPPEPVERDRAVVVLREGLNDADFWPSMHAAEGLTRAGFGAEVRAALAGRVDTTRDARMRCGLARELVRAGDSAIVQILVDVLSGTDPYAHAHAAESLFKLGLVGDESAMRRIYRSGDATARLMAAAALAANGDADALNSIRTTYVQGDASSARIAAWILGRIGDASDKLLLANGLRRNADAMHRAYVDHALAALGDPDGLAALRQNLHSSDPVIRTYAASFAADVDAEASGIDIVTDLIPLLDDAYPDARYRAAAAILLH